MHSVNEGCILVEWSNTIAVHLSHQMCILSMKGVFSLNGVIQEATLIRIKALYHFQSSCKIGVTFDKWRRVFRSSSVLTHHQRILHVDFSCSFTQLLGAPRSPGWPSAKAFFLFPGQQIKVFYFFFSSKKVNKVITIKMKVSVVKRGWPPNHFLRVRWIYGQKGRNKFLKYDAYIAWFDRFEWNISRERKLKNASSSRLLSKLKVNHQLKHWAAVAHRRRRTTSTKMWVAYYTTATTAPGASVRPN